VCFRSNSMRRTGAGQPLPYGCLKVIMGMG
jgi:hypothetical protein